MILNKRLDWIALSWGPLALALALGGCDHKTDGPIPELSSVMPQAACNEQVAQIVMVKGDKLSPLNDHTLLDKSRLELPQITLLRVKDIDGKAVDSTGTNAIDVPNDPDHPEASDEAWSSQMDMSFGICPPGTCSQMMPPTPPLLSDWPVDAFSDKKIPSGLYSIRAKNRAQEKAVTLDDSIAIVPIPDLKRVDADLACKDMSNVVKLSGDFFLVVNGTKPVVRLYDDAGFDKKLDAAMLDLQDCRDLPAPTGFSLKACKTINATIPAGFVTFKSDTDTFRNLRLQVTGPTPVACHSTTDVEITFVPEPKLQKIVPDVACDAEGDRMFQLQGFGFLTVDGKTPTVNLDMKTMPPANAALDCTEVGRVGFPREKVQSCKTLALTIPKGTLPPVMPGSDPANYAVTVTNPPPADCMSTPPVDLTITAPPLVSSVVPDLACNAQGDRQFTITGKAFVQIDKATADATFTDAMGKAVTVSAMYDPASCKVFPGPTETLQICTVMNVTVPKAMLASGVAGVTVKNPDPAGCSSSPAAPVLIVPPPSIAAAKPAQVCTAQGSVPVLLTGSDFLTVDGKAPIATFTPQMGMAIVTAPGTVANCTPVMGASEVVQKCTDLTVMVPMAALMVQTSYTVTVTNPDPAGCTSESNPPVTVVGAPPPTIASFSPMQLCIGGGSVTLSGTNFEQGAQVSVGPVAATGVTVSNGGTVAVATIPNAGLLPGMSYPVKLTNPSGCSATAANQLSVVIGMTVFYVDPPTVWNGITTQVTVYGTNVMGGIQAVSIAPSGTQNWMPLKNIVVTGANRATALVPSGVAAGTYDVQVGDKSACSSILAGGLKVVANPTLTVSTIDPKTGYINADTAVTIKGAGFTATPRVYLSSGNANAAVALSAVSFLDGNTLTATVPKGLAVATYDLIIVNPDGQVGVLTKAFRTITNPTPLILTLSPGSIGTQPTTVQIIGQNFQQNAAVTFTCRNDAGGAVAAPGGLTISAPQACGQSQCINVSGTFPTSGFCVVTVTNPTDQSSFDFSSLVITNPAQKLGVFGPTATSMNTGRRALGVVTAQVSPTSRFLYALGGDAGTEAGALDTVEAAPVDVYGTLGRWFRLRSASGTSPSSSVLTSKRTFVGATVVGRFLYAVGGSNGSAALRNIDRAYVLDPAQDTSRFTDLNFDIAPMGQAGLAPGVYSYRVAPIMAQGDKYNPGGENLPSDPQLIQVPKLLNNAGVYVTLTWASVAGSTGYNLYRSAVNGAGGTEVLIKQNVQGTSLQDANLAPVMVNGATLSPLPIGSLGVWHSAGLLATARSGAGVTETPDPVTPSSHYLYALGGNSGTEGSPTTLASTEIIKITVSNDSSQSAATVLAGPNLQVAKWQTNASINIINGTAYIWSGAGLTNNQATSDYEGATITTGTGVLSNWQGIAAVTGGTRAGYVGLAINGYLYAFGGAGAAPDNSARQAQVATPPAINNWNTATTLSTNRYLHAGTVASSFIFICGGMTGGGMPAASCETSTLGRPLHACRTHHAYTYTHYVRITFSVPIWYFSQSASHSVSNMPRLRGRCRKPCGTGAGQAVRTCRLLRTRTSCH